VGPRAVLDAVKKKFPAPAGNRTLEPRSSSLQLSTIPTELSRLVCSTGSLKIRFRNEAAEDKFRTKNYGPTAVSATTKTQSIFGVVSKLNDSLTLIRADGKGSPPIATPRECRISSRSYFI
jgi:hypothetical protein